MNFDSACIRQIQDINNTLVDSPSLEAYRYEAVDRLCKLFSASAAVFFHYADTRGELDNVRREDLYFSGMDSNYQELYFSEVRQTDPLTLWGWKKGKKSRVTTLSSIVSPRKLKSTSLYRKIQSPNKNYDILAIPLIVNKRLLGNISVTRPLAAAEFDQSDIQLAELLAPSLSASYCNLVQAEEIDRIHREKLPDHDSKPALLNVPQGDQFGLSRREREILEKISEGMNSPEIGAHLSISPWTVKNHLQSIYRKVGANNRVSLLNKLTT